MEADECDATKADASETDAPAVKNNDNDEENTSNANTLNLVDGPTIDTKDSNTAVTTDVNLGDTDVQTQSLSHISNDSKGEESEVKQDSNEVEHENAAANALDILMDMSMQIAKPVNVADETSTTNGGKEEYAEDQSEKLDSTLGYGDDADFLDKDLTHYLQNATTSTSASSTMETITTDVDCKTETDPSATNINIPDKSENIDRKTETFTDQSETIADQSETNADQSEIVSEQSETIGNKQKGDTNAESTLGSEGIQISEENKSETNMTTRNVSKLKVGETESDDKDCSSTVNDDTSNTASEQLTLDPESGLLTDEHGTIISDKQESTTEADKVVVVEPKTDGSIPPTEAITDNKPLNGQITTMTDNQVSDIDETASHDAFTICDSNSISSEASTLSATETTEKQTADSGKQSKRSANSNEVVEIISDDSDTGDQPESTSGPVTTATPTIQTGSDMLRLDLSASTFLSSIVNPASLGDTATTSSAASDGIVNATIPNPLFQTPILIVPTMFSTAGQSMVTPTLLAVTPNMATANPLLSAATMVAPSPTISTIPTPVQIPNTPIMVTPTYGNNTKTPVTSWKVTTTEKHDYTSTQFGSGPYMGRPSQIVNPPKLTDLLGDDSSKDTQQVAKVRINTDRTVTESMHYCPICPKGGSSRFVNEYPFRQHLEKVHKIKDYPYAYKCPFIEHKSWLFFHLGAVQSHVTQFHVKYIQRESITFERTYNQNFKFGTIHQRVALERRNERKSTDDVQIEGGIIVGGATTIGSITSTTPSSSSTTKEDILTDFKCPLCRGLLFKNEEALFRHMVFYHETKIPPYVYMCCYAECADLPKMFSVLMVKKHMKEVHKPGDKISDLITRSVHPELQPAVIVANALKDNFPKERGSISEREKRWKQLMPNARKVPVIFDPKRPLGRKGDIVSQTPMPSRFDNPAVATPPQATTSANPKPIIDFSPSVSNEDEPSSPNSPIVLSEMKKCPKCPFKTTDASLLGIHYNNEHTKVHSRRSRCLKCNINFPDNDALATHLVQQHHGGSLKCPKCQVPFTNTEKLHNHMQQQHQMGILDISKALLPKPDHIDPRLKQLLDKKDQMELAEKLAAARAKSSKNQMDLTDQARIQANIDELARQYQTQNKNPDTTSSAMPVPRPKHTMYECTLSLCNRRFSSLKKVQLHLADFHRIKNISALRDVVKVIQGTDDIQAPPSGGSGNHGSSTSKTTTTKPTTIPQAAVAAALKMIPLTEAEEAEIQSQRKQAKLKESASGKPATVLDIVRSALEKAITSKEASQAKEAEKKEEKKKEDIKSVDLLKGVTISESDFEKTRLTSARVVLRDIYEDGGLKKIKVTDEASKNAEQTHHETMPLSLKSALESVDLTKTEVNLTKTKPQLVDLISDNQQQSTTSVSIPIKPATQTAQTESAQSKKFIDRFSIAWDAPESVNLSSAMMINVNVNVTNTSAGSAQGVETSAAPKQQPDSGATTTKAANKTGNESVSKVTKDNAVCLISDDSDEDTKNTKLAQDLGQNQTAAKNVYESQRKGEDTPPIPIPTPTAPFEGKKTFGKTPASEEELRKFIMAQMEKYKKPIQPTTVEPVVAMETTPKSETSSIKTKLRQKICDTKILHEKPDLAAGLPFGSSSALWSPRRNLPRRETYLSRGAYRESDQSDHSADEASTSVTGTTPRRKYRKKRVDSSYVYDDNASTASGGNNSSDDEWMPGEDGIGGENEAGPRMRKRRRISDVTIDDLMTSGNGGITEKCPKCSFRTTDSALMISHINAIHSAHIEGLDFLSPGTISLNTQLAPEFLAPEILAPEILAPKKDKWQFVNYTPESIARLKREPSWRRIKGAPADKRKRSATATVSIDCSDEEETEYSVSDNRGSNNDDSVSDNRGSNMDTASSDNMDTTTSTENNPIIPQLPQPLVIVPTHYTQLKDPHAPVDSSQPVLNIVPTSATHSPSHATNINDSSSYATFTDDIIRKTLGTNPSGELSTGNEQHFLNQLDEGHEATAVEADDQTRAIIQLLISDDDANTEQLAAARDGNTAAKDTAEVEKDMAAADDVLNPLSDPGLIAVEMPQSSSDDVSFDPLPNESESLQDNAVESQSEESQSSDQVGELQSNNNESQSNVNESQSNDNASQSNDNKSQSNDNELQLNDNESQSSGKVGELQANDNKSQSKDNESQSNGNESQSNDYEMQSNDNESESNDNELQPNIDSQQQN